MDKTAATKDGYTTLSLSRFIGSAARTRGIQMTDLSDAREQVFLRDGTIMYSESGLKRLGLDVKRLLNCVEDHIQDVEDGRDDEFGSQRIDWDGVEKDYDA